MTSSAQATRPKLIMSLVLDKSGSMNKNGGAAALPPAVDNFMSYFDDNNDQVAMVSFSSIPTIDVTIRTNFTTTIVNAINAMKFGGATYAEGGLLDGQAQINSATVPSGASVVKVAVFFTDGWANTIQTHPAMSGGYYFERRWMRASGSCGRLVRRYRFHGSELRVRRIVWCNDFRLVTHRRLGSVDPCRDGRTQCLQRRDESRGSSRHQHARSRYHGLLDRLGQQS